MAGLETWRNLRFRSKGLIVIAVPAVATVLIACAAYLLGDRAADAERAVARIHHASQETQRLDIHEARMSALIRGYFVTGEPTFKNQAREEIAAFDVSLRKLFELTAQSETQTREVSQIARLARARLEGIFAATAHFESGGLGKEALRAVLRVQEAERKQIETVISRLLEEQTRVQARESAEADKLHADLRAVTGFCVLFGVLGGVVISLLFASGITNRVRKLQENVSKLATGGELDLLPEGQDEIGDLCRGVSQTSQMLRQRTGALENAPYGFAQVDETGHYLSINQAYARIACVSDRDRAATVALTVQPDDRAKVTSAINLMRASGAAEVELRIVDNYGAQIDVAMTFQPPVTASDGGYYVFLRDITLRKQTEDALVRAKEAAEASSLAKNDFLAKISHDIRTPLNAILGAANLLSESPLNPDQAEYVNMFQRNCARLVTLINDFLDFSKIEAGALKLERIPFRVRETVEDAAATFRESAARKGVALSVDIAADVPDWEMGDPLRVQQVVVNLLSNAIKFTEQGRVAVQVARSPDSGGDWLRFEVADTGPGIRPEDQERIFGAFTQLPGQRAGRNAGCGLGLAICRELVERMGGEIGITSELGRGSRFHFQFPLEAALPRDAARAPAIPNLQPQEHGILRVLVAEDAEDNRLLLKHYLRGEPLEVRFAADGREALNEIQSGATFDLIMMDLDMPELNGYEATKLIHEWQASRHEILTPVVALSAHAMRDAEQASLAAGCSAHVAKPVDRATLLSAIRRYATARNTIDLNDGTVNDAIQALVPKFLASKPKQIEEARAALAVKEFEPIRRFGHNLKGTGRGYGFPAIEEMGREIEQAAAKGDEKSIARQLANLYEFVTSDPAASVSASS